MSKSKQQHPKPRRRRETWWCIADPTGRLCDFGAGHTRKSAWANFANTVDYEGQVWIARSKFPEHTAVRIHVTLAPAGRRKARKSR
jgi:hypothetical protein